MGELKLMMDMNSTLSIQKKEEIEEEEDQEEDEWIMFYS